MFRDRIPGAGKTKWVAAARCFVTKPSAVLGMYTYICGYIYTRRVIRIPMCVYGSKTKCASFALCAVVVVPNAFVCIDIRSVSAAVAANSAG